MILDKYAAGTIADALDEVMDDLGFPPEEAIPGLVASITRMAGRCKRPDIALDEAATLLADGVE
jgi:hypothetical protein